MNLSANWNLQIDDSVFKFLKKIPRKNRDAILYAIKFLPVNPYFGDVQKMKAEENSWRRRVGRYRIFYKIKIEQKVVLVFKVKLRDSNTY